MNRTEWHRSMVSNSMYQNMHNIVSENFTVRVKNHFVRVPTFTQWNRLGGGGRLTVPLDLKRNLVDQNHSCASTECAAGGAVWPMCGRTTRARKGEGPDPECSERTVSTCLPSSLHQCTCVTVCLVYGVPQHGRTRSPFRDPPPNLTWTTMHQRPVLFAG